MSIQSENIYKNKIRHRRSHPTPKDVGFPAFVVKNRENTMSFLVFHHKLLRTNADSKAQRQWLSTERSNHFLFF